MTVEGRMKREGKTITSMIGLYCRDHHGTEDGGLCAACGELLTYAMERLERCTFRDNKPTCAKCPVHCYKPAMRERIRDVMRYAGPRMLRRDPVGAVMHLIDGFRKPPAPKKKA